MNESQVTFWSSDDAFDFAIDTCRLSADPASPIYAGRYMYMGHKGGLAMFKHIETRQYLGAPKISNYLCATCGKTGPEHGHYDVTDPKTHKFVCGEEVYL